MQTTIYMTLPVTPETRLVIDSELNNLYITMPSRV